MNKALAFCMAFAPTLGFADTEATGSWINLNDAELRTELQSSIDALKAQTRQIFTNRDINYQQDLDIQHNLDLINALDGQINERITQVSTTIDNQFTALEGDISNGFDDVDNQFRQLDQDLDNEFSEITGQLISSNQELDEHYSILVALNNQTKTLNGVDVISGRTSSSGSLSSQLSALQSDMRDGQAIIADHERRLNDGASAISSLQSLVNTKATLSDVKNNVRVGLNTSNTCVRYSYEAYIQEGGGNGWWWKKRESTSYPTGSRIRNIKCEDYSSGVSSAYLY